MTDQAPERIRAYTGNPKIGEWHAHNWDSFPGIPYEEYVHADIVDRLKDRLAHYRKAYLDLASFVTVDTMNEFYRRNKTMPKGGA